VSQAFAELAKRTEEISPFLAVEVFERAQELERQGHEVVHLEFGEPDFETPEVVREAAVRAIREGRTKYAHSLGLLPLGCGGEAEVNLADTVDQLPIELARPGEGRGDHHQPEAHARREEDPLERRDALVADPLPAEPAARLEKLRAHAGGALPLKDLATATGLARAKVHRYLPILVAREVRATLDARPRHRCGTFRSEEP